MSTKMFSSLMSPCTIPRAWRWDTADTTFTVELYFYCLLIKEFITIADDLCKDPPGLGLRQPRALLYEVEERDAGAALHHEEVVVRVLEHGHAPAVADQSEAGIVVT